MHGRIDVHAHLIPGIDDGCATVAESIECGKMLVGAGYTHAFCTPHIWPNLPGNNVEEIGRKTLDLQREYDAAGVGLKLLPGGELNLRPEMVNWPKEKIPSYGMLGRYCLFDLWCDELPDFFWPVVKHLQECGLTVILAHPERMRAVYENIRLVWEFIAEGLALQGNLQCLSDAPNSPTWWVMERLLVEDCYDFLGTDTHKPATLPMRLEGLERAAKLVGEKKVDELTRINPQDLLKAPDSAHRKE